MSSAPIDCGERLYTSGNSRAGTWICEFYFRLANLLRRCKEEKVRSDGQEKEDVGGTGKVEHDIAEKESRRRHTLVTEL